ncbi:asparagine synthase (glutamine-hydrolyzing) [Bacillus marinisedimentorum]|uniref:asparagine synthase (glutamine-hydrolyzing) n=1 Tax=Bacillus marinisedimentorum TaxID=1821260 RepID=UPI0007E25884|nr:asparagine synthase (glutamine-hydrolyzing) [Bacillus marinisedimentorum]
MCGFVGRLYDNEQDHVKEEDEALLKTMNELLVHRGPDDSGYYLDEWVHFGFRRLSIIDLEHGHQPLSYENERYWIVFNGEVYNYLELKQDLLNKGCSFLTDSDTEIILACYSIYGQKTAEKLRGMFAFLIWDKDEKQLYGARDPFGIKPLYYYTNSGNTYFSSEKKSLLAAMPNDLVDYTALQHYLTYQYVPEPMTMSQMIHKLPPGSHFIKKPGEPLNISQYWHVSFSGTHRTPDKLAEKIRQTLTDSVKIHMRSDVPVGSFLSGGIDSTAIVSIAKQFNPAIKTFSVGFEQNGYSEISIAKETAEKLGVENISLMVSPEEFINELPKIIWYMDDPLADPASIPLYFVAKEARNHVKVVLSGEGADELFGGYNIYREPESLKIFNSMPALLKKGLRTLADLMPEGVRGKSFIERGTTPLEERYIGNAKMLLEEEKQSLLANYNEKVHFMDITRPFYKECAGFHPVDKMQYIDIHTWLRGDILLKADKMTMAHSLELRVPFLDKEVCDLASQIHHELKISNQTTKWILRKAMDGVVPAHVLNRKKLGFPVPIRHWLKDELYDWTIKTIKDSHTEHLLNKRYVLSMLEDHVTGKRDHSRKIWTVLTFMLWHQVYLENAYDFELVKGAGPSLMEA